MNMLCKHNNTYILCYYINRFQLDVYMIHIIIIPNIFLEFKFDLDLIIYKQLK